jgi:osmotically-inducible protein OsmY
MQALTILPDTRGRDALLQQEVLQELRWDTRVAETEVGVSVEEGVVTLTGTVGSYGKKLAAGEAAHRVPGVWDVANDLQVKVPGLGTPTDAEVALAVRTRLRRDAFLPHEQVQTTVSDGWITLEGTVTLGGQREDAERVVSHLAGVRGVTNHLRVVTPQVDPRDLHRAIREALDRRSWRAAERIEVRVREGVVTLTGHVQSWQEQRALLGAVSHMPGVQAVEDDLHLDVGG